MNVYIASIVGMPSHDHAELAARRRLETDRNQLSHEDFAAGLLLHVGLDLDIIDRVHADAASDPAHPSPYFCANRGGSYAAAVVSDYGYVGVGIEPVGAHEVADNDLHESEHEWLNERADRDLAAACLLAAKDSLRLAADGGLEPTSYSILPVSSAWHVIAQGSWHFNWRKLDGHILCVCSMRPEKIELKYLKPNDLVA